MTILTKTVTEKKFDKLDDEPLINNEVNESMVATKPPKLVSVTFPAPVPAHVCLARAKARRLGTVTTICACITAVLVLVAGVIGGVYLYQQLVSTQDIICTWFTVPIQVHCIRVSCRMPFPQKMSTVYGSGNHQFVSAKHSGHQGMDQDMADHVLDGGNHHYLSIHSRHQGRVLDQDGVAHMINGGLVPNRSVPVVRCAGAIHVISNKMSGQDEYHDHVADAKKSATFDGRDAAGGHGRYSPQSSYDDRGIANMDPFEDAALPIARADRGGFQWSFFDQWFEIDVESKQYEEMTVPDFSGGRRGRFIHDFSSNKTGIVDLDGRRCFVMPLNRSLVLPPQSLFDLVLKMKAGYYEVDTAVVRETMLIVYPKITDYKSVGYYIARECSSLNTYMLKRLPKNRRRMGKRSTGEDDQSIVFTEFAGKKMLQFTIVDDETAKE